MGKWAEIGVGSGDIISVLVAAVGTTSVGLYERTPCEFGSISVCIYRLLYALCLWYLQYLRYLI